MRPKPLKDQLQDNIEIQATDYENKIVEFVKIKDVSSAVEWQRTHDESIHATILHLVIGRLHEDVVDEIRKLLEYSDKIRNQAYADAVEKK